MPSSQSQRKARPKRKIHGHTIEGSFGCGNWTSGNVQAATLDGLLTKLERRAEVKKQRYGREQLKRGNSRPDSASGTGRKWFT